MNRKDYSIPMLKAQSASLPFALAAVVEVGLFAAMWGVMPIKASADILLPWYFLPIFVVGIIIHELIHGLSWMAAGRLSFSQMKFGVQWKTLTPYAHYTVPIRKSAYVFGTMMPAVVLGFIPYGFSLLYGNGWVLIVSVLFTFAAVGDFLIVWLIRSAAWDALVEDHTENAGCFVYEETKPESSSKTESA